MVKEKKETQNAIGELQMLQQRAQVFAAQKQQFQLQLLEIENALKEVSNSKGPVYKLIGELLIEKNSDEVKTDLAEKQKDLDIRIKSIEKQEKILRDRSADLQKSIKDSLKE